MRTSEAINEIAAALAAAQATYPAVGKDKTGAVRGRTKEGKEYQYEYDYADLASVLEVIRPCLAKQGIAVVQSASADSAQVAVVTRLVHSSGQWFEASLIVEADGTAPQKLGSAITYARRYGFLALAGVAPREEDDDGAAADHTRKPPPSPPRQRTPEPVKVPEPALLERKIRILEWFERRYKPEHMLSALERVAGRPFPPGEEPPKLTVKELEALEKHKEAEELGGEDERQAGQGK